MSRTASAIAIVLAAVALTPTSAQSAEITGCLSKRGTLTKVASGARPLGGACGSRGERVSIPVISGGAGPGTARIDSYPFFVEVSTAGAQPFPGSGTGATKVLFELKIGNDLLVGLDGGCSEFNGKNTAILEAASHIISNVVAAPEFIQSSVPGEITLITKISQQWPDLDPFDLATDVLVAHFIDSHIRVKIDAAATVDRGSPALCTFSGTVDVIRAR